jgi:hypothetical protein
VAAAVAAVVAAAVAAVVEAVVAVVEAVVEAGAETPAAKTQQYNDPIAYLLPDGVNPLVKTRSELLHQPVQPRQQHRCE